MARAMVSDIASRRALLEHAIAVLVGEPASDFSIPAAVTPFVLPEIPTDIPSTLLQRRPDIASAERAAAAANADIGVARAAFYPSLTFDPVGGLISTGNPFKLADTFWTLGATVALPLFDGGRLRAQEAATYARFRETSAFYRSTVLIAFKEVEDNRALLHWLAQESTDTEAGVTAADHTAQGGAGPLPRGRHELSRCGHRPDRLAAGAAICARPADSPRRRRCRPGARAGRRLGRDRARRGAADQIGPDAANSRPRQSKYLDPD